MNTIRKYSNNLLTKSLLILSFAFATFFLSGCKEEDGFSGSMEVEMTDGPGEYVRVDVEIEKVELKHESDGWITLTNDSRVYTVTDLTNGNTAMIASKSDLKAGFYSQARITFGSNSSIQASLASALINFNNSTEEAVVIDINYNVEAETNNTILLDFRVAESIVEGLGTYLLDPTINYVQDPETGVQGELEGNAKAFVKLEGNGRSYDTYSDENGKFMIQGSVSGEYNLIIEPRSDQGYAQTTIQGVVVVDGEITNMGTVNLDQ